MSDLKIKIVSSERDVICESNENIIYLVYDNWNDYGYITQFTVFAFEKDKKTRVGDVKIAEKSMSLNGESRVIDLLGRDYSSGSLPDGFFSLGQSLDFYKKSYELFKEKIFLLLNDVSFNDMLYGLYSGTEVFKNSLARFISESEIKYDFYRVSHSLAVRDYYELTLKYECNNLVFKVDHMGVKNNMNVVIGANGVGKSRFLKEICEGFNSVSYNKNSNYNAVRGLEDISDLVVFSFGFFDGISPSSSKYPRSYKYIGLKKSDNKIKDSNEIFEEFFDCLNRIMVSEEKKKDWENSLPFFSSDEIFSAYAEELTKISERYLRNAQKKISEAYQKEISCEAKKVFEQMSSGHKMVVFSISAMIRHIGDRTIMLYDEPEAYLHPPLLANLIAAISDILDKRNAIGVVCTHSPVVLQEVFSESVWIVKRDESGVFIKNPNIETYGENINTLIKGVFGLQLSSSGFYKDLKEKIDNIFSENIRDFDVAFDRLMALYQREFLGSEAMSVAQNLILSKINQGR